MKLTKLILKFVMMSAMLVAFSNNAIAANLTPVEILNRCKAKMAKAKTVQANFVIQINERNYRGQFKSKGNKFALLTNLTNTWYDGTDMWTYNPKSRETTIMKPTVAELVEVNPLMYLNTSDDYTIGSSKEKTNANDVVVLIPKKKNTGIRFVTLFINKKTWLPFKVVVTDDSGDGVAVTINDLVLDKKIDDSVFVYPKADYPKAKLVDLR